jgi:excisionase family DNA binding protein
MSSLSPVGDRFAALVDVRAVAVLLACSPRHVYRLADAGRMPPPLKLGSLVRWERQTVEDWVRAGCPTCRKSPKGVGR